MTFKNVTRLLVDSRNLALLDEIPKVLQVTDLAGLDIETEDSAKHEGLVDVKGDPIDFQRSKLCGLSIYPNEADYAFYINIGHADVENRVPWPLLEKVLSAYEGHWVIHNAPFERAMLELTQNFILKQYICSMQLCVTAYNEDEYPLEKFFQSDLGEMAKFMTQIDKHFADFDRRKGLTHKQGQLVGKILAKESRSAHSYNGFVQNLTYGYGLKKAVKSWFDVDMVTFQEALNGKEHMGQLTGEEASLYGADDAIWCMRLYNKVMQYLLETNPQVIETFFNQELPMCELYAGLKRDGLKINLPAVKQRRDMERVNYANALRKIKASVAAVLPFERDPVAILEDREDWYKKNHERYRKRIASWATSPDSEDHYEQCVQVSSPVGNQWAIDKLGGKAPKNKNLNLTHYMVTRTLFYDLLQLPVIMDKGKVQSDNEARQQMFEDLQNEVKEKTAAGDDHSKLVLTKLEKKKLVLECINELSSIDQRMKLYLNPYIHLIDPDTSRVYPTLSSMLNSRRMATQYPNPMQLAKRGASTYVRGFYLPDHEDDVIVSLDWSQIELVLIGEFSGDPEFAKSYGQLPYEDLHLGAAADCLSVVCPGLDIDVYKSLKNMPDADAALHDNLSYLFRSTAGEALTPGKAYKYWRTEVGKGANFNYWYSGALSTVGQRLGWTPEVMWEATERYRTRFKVAEQWRVDTIHAIQRDGFITLPDKHRRVRFEATQQWEQMWMAWWMHYANASNSEGIKAFAQFSTNAIKRRASNQAVNSMIQGTSATLAKRSAYRVHTEAKKMGFKNFRFMLPVHDELIFNVHKREVWDFIQFAKVIMCDHKDIISNLVVDCTASVGRTYEPFNMKSVPFGQVEIDEAPALPFVPKNEIDGKMSQATVDELVRYLCP